MRLAFLSALSFSLLAAGSGLAVAADPKADVTAAYAAWDAAFNKGDAKAVSAAYTDDAKLLPPTHKVASGPAEIAKFFEGIIGSKVTDHKLQLLDAGGDGNVVYSTARWTAKAKDKEVGGLATHVFVRQPGGSLRLRVHAFN